MAPFKGRVQLAVAVTVLACVIAAGCGGTSSGGGNAVGDAKTKANIAAILYATADPYFKQAYCGAQESAARGGFDLQWQGPAKFDPPAELAALNAVAQRKPYVVVLNPADPNALMAPVRALMANGTPVVTFDGALTKPIEAQNVRTDGRAAGAAAAEKLGTLIGGRGTVAIQGAVPGLLTLTDHVEGFKEALAANFPNIKVLPTQYSGGDATKASSTTQALLKANPSLNGIYTVVSVDAGPTLAGIKAAGRAGKVTLVACNATPANVRLLQQGAIAAVVAQDPVKTIQTALRTAHSLASGKASADSLTKQVLLPATLITKDNLNDPEVTPLLATTC